MKATPRNLALFILAASLGAIGGAWIYQSLGYLPCELCYKERIPFYAVMILAPLTIYALRKARKGLTASAFLLMALLFAGDAALSLYHTGVELKLVAGPSDCSGPLTTAGSVEDFMKQLQTVKVVRCDEPSLWVFGMTLANWNVVISTMLAWLAFMGLRRSYELR